MKTIGTKNIIYLLIISLLKHINIEIVYMIMLELIMIQY